MIEIDDYTPTAAIKGRKRGSKNAISLEREALLEEARQLNAKGVSKICAALGLDMNSKLRIKPETFAKLI
jgi:hypothetical protein